MEAPFKKLRESLGLTIDQLAEEAGISRLAIIRNEQACYTSPSPTLLGFFLPLIDFDADSFFFDYREFQKNTRRLNFGRLSLDVLKALVSNSDSSPPLISNPVAIWRTSSGLSKAKVSTLYCIHPDVVSRIECRPHLIPVGFPSQFTDALIQSGYDPEQLSQLESLFGRYRDRLSTPNPLTTLNLDAPPVGFSRAN